MTRQWPPEGNLAYLPGSDPGVSRFDPGGGYQHRSHNPLFDSDSGGGMASLALLVDTLRPELRGRKIGRFLDVAGCLAHANQIELRFGRNVGNCLMP